MSTQYMKQLRGHELWFAWGGYLVLRPRRARRTPAPRHPAWIACGRPEYPLPPAVTAMLAPAGGVSATDHGRLVG